MEEMQKQTADAQTPHRRRAVRSVRMGSSGGAEQVSPPTADAGAAVVPSDGPTAEKTAPSVPSSGSEDWAESAVALDAALTEALNDAFRDLELDPGDDIQKEASAEAEPLLSDAACAEPFMTPGFPVQAEEAPDEEAHVHRRSALFAQTEEFPAEGRETADSESGIRRSVLMTAGILAALLLVCMVIVLPLLKTTEAVMLYVDDTAVGYLADIQDADRQAVLLQDTLAELALPVDAETLYRCETAKVRGTVSTLSDGAVYDALFAKATDGYVRAYRLIPTVSDHMTALPSDGSWSGAAIGVMTEAEILSAIDAAEAICGQRYAENLPTGTELTVTPCFTWDLAWISEQELLDEGALAAWLTDEQTMASGILSVTAQLMETEAERIPYETTYVPNDENFDGIRSMISAGSDGLAQVSYLVSLNPVTGDVLSRAECARTVVRAPVNAVAYEGLYPLPDGAATGTFVWPLPPLPDDEMPLDENGEPYMPENTLALKNTYVSSGYGERLLWGVTDFHLGLDIVAPAYTEIYAADGGVVVYAAHTSSYGYMTRIRHADNVETVYAHQIKQVVKPGDVVEQGQLIGYVGSTGTSSGNHLHLEFRRDHVTVDPLEYIEIPEDVLVLGEGS